MKTTIRPSLQSAAVSALGDRQGAIAVVEPRTGNVLGVAGLALNGPQPPGSSFKIITLAAALNEGETEAVRDVPGADAGDALGRRAAQRGRRVVRRLAHHLVRALVQLGLRPARRAARREAARPLRRGVRLQREAADPGREAQHDPARPQGRPRGRRERDRPGPRPRHRAHDGERRRDDRQPRGPPPAADPAQRRARRTSASSSPAVADEVREHDARGRPQRDGRLRGAPGRRDRGQDRHGRAGPDGGRGVGPRRTPTPGSSPTTRPTRRSRWPSCSSAPARAARPPRRSPARSSPRRSEGSAGRAGSPR